MPKQTLLKCAGSWKLSVCRGQQPSEAKIEVDNLKNVPSLAIFYWFLFLASSFNLPSPPTLLNRLSFHCRWVEMKSFKRLLQSRWNIPALLFIDLCWLMHRVKTILLHFYVRNWSEKNFDMKKIKRNEKNYELETFASSLHFCSLDFEGK